MTGIATTGGPDANYQAVFGDVSRIIDAARDSAARSVNAAMTGAYWLTGRRIVEFEQLGAVRAEYGAALMERLTEDLTWRFGRGFSRQNVYNMRQFYLAYQPDQILQTPTGEFDTPYIKLGFEVLLKAFRSPGLPTCGCCRSGMSRPANSTRPRRCAEDGRSANSTGRSVPSSTSAPPCPGTGPPC